MSFSSFILNSHLSQRFTFSPSFITKLYAFPGSLYATNGVDKLINAFLKLSCPRFITIFITSSVCNPTINQKTSTRNSGCRRNHRWHNFPRLNFNRQPVHFFQPVILRPQICACVNKIDVEIIIVILLKNNRVRHYKLVQFVFHRNLIILKLKVFFLHIANIFNNLNRRLLIFRFFHLNRLIFLLLHFLLHIFKLLLRNLKFWKLNIVQLILQQYQIIPKYYPQKPTYF